MKKALILHGWGANPYMHWFPAEQEILQEHGYLVCAPPMPDKYNPTEDEWLQVIEDFGPQEDSILIGHSLGGTTILEYLEKTNQKVDTVVLACAPIFFRDAIKKNDREELKEFIESVYVETFLSVCDYEKIYDWEKIRKSANKFILIYKTLDIIGPKVEGEVLSEKLKTELILLPGSDHGDIIDVGLINERLFSSS